MSSQRILNVGLSGEQDVVLVRQRARQVSGLLGFSQQDQVRVATAVSEVARGACQLGFGGRALFQVLDQGGRQWLEMTITTGSTAAAAPLPDDAVVTAHRLMDECTIGTDARGAPAVTMRKSLPPQAYVGPARLAELGAQLAKDSPVANSYLEVHQQNQELVATLAELRERQEDLLDLTRELEDTNRGIVALYAEIEDKAERLRLADEMKSRFLSNTSHELRTPLSSIRALARLLLDRLDGDLTQEQERQVKFIERAANDLSELVNDLLDLAKIEAGKVDLQVAPVVPENLFRALKGMLRPLVDESKVELVFEPPEVDEAFESDEGKISQVLRNFISNALKFTEQGSVKVSALQDREHDTITFTVADTGIGISAENLQLIFEEFSQIEHPLQRRSKGTGLGLPLCRKLAELLGGRVEVESQVGAGSTFRLVLPRSLPQIDG
ncbi:histidine kinase [Massilia sp. WF1]|uniref:ATP-binding protein n=1 Tax=unclassified Massilia TaxID=2609279 RepID=UPI00064AF62E|nr:MULTISPECIES: sensor histidine kinase [unclassified Massilia]ALK98124.1 histidine kinase [Massilia sp. WG5]KLU35596.1 histidine kinase [Massilia sp. WF1]